MLSALLLAVCSGASNVDVSQPAALAGQLPVSENSRRETKPDIEVIPDFPSKFLVTLHTIRVLLPVGYERDVRRRYPVLYLQDGQNLFGPQRPTFPNFTWQADTTALTLQRAGLMEPTIIVGIDNAGAARADEYLPTRAATSKGVVFGGLGAKYVQMLIEEVKPMIDRRYRTLRGATDTGIGGSSLGAIISLYAAISHPEVFSRVGCFSPSVWWDHRWIVGQISALQRKPRVKIWLDIGSAEDEDAEPDAVALNDALVAKGWRTGNDLAFYIDDGAHHEERAWAHRLPYALMFLFPVR